MDPADSTRNESSDKKRFPVTELDYELPERLIAQVPAEQRADSRLMVVDRATGALLDRGFRELVGILRPCDLLALNNTRVLPAKFGLRRRTGGRMEGLFLHEREAGVWEVMLRGASRLKPDEPLSFVGPGNAQRWTVRAGENLGQGRWVVRVEPGDAAAAVLPGIGRSPLPPYIHRRSDDSDLDRLDAKRYQTVYAKRPGAIAAPTAGLHFTGKLLDELFERGVDRIELTLHVGMDTFAPVTADDLAEHEMHAEWYSLDSATADRVNQCRATGGRIVAVGTTTVRVLESCVDSAGLIQPQSGWTRTFCYPPYDFRAVDVLLTNFHLPRSTLLALVMAFAGVERTRRAYRHAVAQEYRFFSYGDAMLII